MGYMDERDLAFALVKGCGRWQETMRKPSWTP